MRALALLLCLLPGLALGAVSNIATTPQDSVSLVSASNAASNGRVTLGLRFRLAPGWHIDWSNPGDVGLPPTIALDPPAEAGTLAFPPPRLLVQGTIADYVLTGDILLPFTATDIGTNVTASATWLVCRDICIPEHARFTLALPGGPSAEASLFATPRIVASPFAATIAPDGTLSLIGPTAAQVAAAHFFPAAPDEIINRAPQTLAFTPTGLTLRLAPAPGFMPTSALTGIIELTDPSGAMQALTLRATPGAAPIARPAAVPLIVWLGCAFLGGLILNLMPCVFPILAMKALALCRLGGQSRAAIRREAFGYTAGVLAAMLILAATLLAARGIGIVTGGGLPAGGLPAWGLPAWGFQFQSPVFVAIIAWLIFAATLNLAGLFELSIPFGTHLATRHSFFTGLLAVVVATPCTAPFMGGAVAAALAAPPAAALGIFLCLGLGLAAPFLLLALIPALAALLPRPGRWMLVLQRLLSIPMFATFLWLAWLLRREAGIGGLELLLLGAVLLGLAVSRRALRPAALAALLVLPFLRTVHAAPPLTLPGATPYSAARLAALRAAGTPVFVDMTAAWCVTCLVNDRTTLDSPAIRAGFTAQHVTVLIGDWTNRDAAITTFLQQNNRAGVPLYVFYPPHAAPKILSQILTPDLVLNATAKPR
jgi:thiol:disulfide interchange protein DsbD